jgi:hypothetical protein
MTTQSNSRQIRIWLSLVDDSPVNRINWPEKEKSRIAAALRL